MKYKSKLTIIFCIATVILSLVACNLNTNQGDFDFDWEKNYENNLPFYGETITVAMLPHESNIQRAQLFMTLNPGVTIQMVSVSQNIERAREQLNIELMAGDAPTLIEASLVDYRDPRISRYFADWYPIINSAPTFIEDDWLMNVIHAAAINEELIAFPLMFRFYVVTANSLISGMSEFIDGKRVISLSEMLEFHAQTDTEEQMYLFDDFDAFHVIERSIDSFFSFEEGRVDFVNEHFVDLISQTRDITAHDHMIGDRTWGHWGISESRDRDIDMSENYLFMTVRPAAFPYISIFSDDTMFTNAMYEVNDDGELIISHRVSFILNDGATDAEKALAWEYIRFVAEPYSSEDPENDPHYAERVSLNDVGNRLIHTPVNRNMLRFVAEVTQPSNLWRHYTRSGGDVVQPWTLIHSESDVIEILYERMITAGEMRMTTVRYAPEIIENVIEASMLLFTNGLVSAEQTANDLQNQVELVMMEIGS